MHFAQQLLPLIPSCLVSAVLKGILRCQQQMLPYVFSFEKKEKNNPLLPNKKLVDALPMVSL
jgi:hypothetical protein